MTEYDAIDLTPLPPAACARCGTVADLSPDHPCSTCGGRIWVHVASLPTAPMHGHHEECLRCLVSELAAYRQDPHMRRPTS